jgi:hypothetical protein
MTITIKTPIPNADFLLALRVAKVCHKEIYVMGK